MKISRLFHWLYAILMLLPFVPVVSFGLYYAFNKNAVVPEVTKYESKEVNFNQHLYNGNFGIREGWSAYNNSIIDFSYVNGVGRGTFLKDISSASYDSGLFLVGHSFSIVKNQL